MVAQGVLPFQYKMEDSSAGMTALAGLPNYLELAFIIGLRESIDKHVQARSGTQGYTDAQMVIALILLNLAGGDCVDDLEILEKDEGFSDLLRRVELSALSRKQRRAISKMWRKQRKRCVPSVSAARRFLMAFHNEPEEQKRADAERAFIPAMLSALKGLQRVNEDLMAFVQSRRPHSVATLDQDATLVETYKKAALYCYKHFKAYQPLNTWWAEHGLVAHSEFRDGNVPAGYQQLRVLIDALNGLPQGVERVRLRSDTAGYQEDLLRYCAEGKNKRFGVIDYAIGADVTDAFKKAVAQLPEDAWQSLERKQGEQVKYKGQQWAEVCFVPEWTCQNNRKATYRYLAIREPLRQLTLPEVEPKQQSFSFPTMTFNSGVTYKLFGVVTNLDWAGQEVIEWHRQRCGKSEEVHAVMKDDLAGGKLPSKYFGYNAAWWAIMILALNLNVAMKRLVLGKGWEEKRMKSIRYRLINIPGRVVHHARQLLVHISANHPSAALLLDMRTRMQALAHAPSG
jgi:hypothetical protein